MILTASTSAVTTRITTIVLPVSYATGDDYDAVSTFVHTGTDLVFTGGNVTYNVVTASTATTTNLSYEVLNWSADTLFTTNSPLLYNTASASTVNLTVTYNTSDGGIWTPSTFNIIVPRPLTPEEEERQARVRVEQERRYQEEQKFREIANGKAEVLLRKVLVPAQRAELEEHGYFHVWGKDGHKYRITRGWSHNVHRVCPETGKLKESFCIHPSIQTPVQDNMLAQKLLLEGDPERFFKTAYSRSN